MSEGGRAVYVRGVGAVTPLGDTWMATAAALAAGRGAVAPVDRFDATGFPGGAAAMMPEAATSLRPALQWAERAAREAWDAAALSEAESACDRVGLFVGAEAGRGGWQDVLALARAWRADDAGTFAAAAARFPETLAAEVRSPAAFASHLAPRFGVTGPVATTSLACASASAAIVEGARAIAAGLCDVALCGGAGDAVDPFALAGFGLLGALSARGRAAPFDVDRDGFVLGEGAAFVVLAARRAHADVALVGWGRALDGGSLTAPEAQGEGAARAMTRALAMAGRTAVDHVQAHAAGTVVGDRAEAAALHAVLGSQLSRATVGSVKGALGHWIAGAGALGVLCAVEAMAGGRPLPTFGLARPDPACALPPATNGRGVCETALVNAFAFGGANVSLVLRRAA